MSAVTLTGGSGAPAEAPAKTQGYWAGVGRRLRKDKVALACALVLLAIVLVAIFAPLVAPVDPTKGSILRRLMPIGTPVTVR